MHFLSKDEAKVLEKKLRRELAELSKPKFVVYYDSGNRDYSKAATAISEATGSFSEVRILFLSNSQRINARGVWAASVARNH